MVLYEDNHLIVISKPAGIATMGSEDGEPSLFEHVKSYIKDKYNKPGNVFLGVVSRIDAFVSGVIVFARTSKAASRLAEQFRESEVSKSYVAILEGTLPERILSDGNKGSLTTWLRKNDRLRKVESFPTEVEGAKKGELEFEVIQSTGKLTLVKIRLITGRKHQIRAQFADLGCPVFGDQKYDGVGKLGKQIALHSKLLEFKHPTLKTNLRFEAPIPIVWTLKREFLDLLERL